MFEGQEIGLRDATGRELRCRDVVRVHANCPLGKHTIYGIITYEGPWGARFELDMVHMGRTVAISELIIVGADIRWIGEDPDHLGIEHPALAWLAKSNEEVSDESA